MIVIAAPPVMGPEPTPMAIRIGDFKFGRVLAEAQGDQMPDLPAGPDEDQPSADTPAATPSGLDAALAPVQPASPPGVLANAQAMIAAMTGTAQPARGGTPTVPSAPAATISAQPAPASPAAAMIAAAVLPAQPADVARPDAPPPPKKGEPEEGAESPAKEAPVGSPGPLKGGEARATIPGKRSARDAEALLSRSSPQKERTVAQVPPTETQPASFQQAFLGAGPPVDSTAAAAPLQAAAPEAIITHHLDLAADSAWLDRLTKDIAGAADRSGQLRFSLAPEHLGRLDVALAQGSDGTSIRLTTETREAHRIVAEAQPRLVAEARAQGLTISETKVDLNFSAGGGGQPQAFGNQNARGEGQPRQPMWQRPPDAPASVSAAPAAGGDELYA